MSKVPSVGSIVMFQYGDKPSAAIVTGGAREDGEIPLTVFRESEPAFTTFAGPGGPDGNTPTPACWNWPITA